MPVLFDHLSLEDRRRLMRLCEAKVCDDEIARQLGRHRSTIYRKIKRNWWHDAEVPHAEGYWPVAAHAGGWSAPTPVQASAPSTVAGTPRRTDDAT